MEILKYELKIRYKALICWSIGLSLLFIAGSMEFEGLAGANSESIDVVLNYYPPIVLALMGITEAIDFSTLEGYVWVLGYFGTIIAAFYAITLGVSVVNRELIDKTFEFLFTKPVKRKYILSIKIIAGVLCLTLFSIINCLVSTLVMNPLDSNIDISHLMFISSLGTYIISLLFYTFSIFISAIMKQQGKGSKIINICFLVAFVLGSVYDVVEKSDLLRFFTPFRYFLYEEVSTGTTNSFFLGIPVLVSIVFLILAYSYFDKRDLTEI